METISDELTKRFMLWLDQRGIAYACKICGCEKYRSQTINHVNDEGEITQMVLQITCIECGSMTSFDHGFLPG